MNLMINGLQELFLQAAFFALLTSKMAGWEHFLDFIAAKPEKLL
jgi:hypothetical protein